MKVIRIFLTNGEYISVKDQDDSDIVSYSKTLSDLLQSSNVTMLHTSESSLIIRPSKIQAVLVCEEKQESKAKEIQDADIQENTEGMEETQESEDIISD